MNLEQLKSIPLGSRRFDGYVEPKDRPERLLDSGQILWFKFISEASMWTLYVVQYRDEVYEWKGPYKNVSNDAPHPYSYREFYIERVRPDGTTCGGGMTISENGVLEAVHEGRLAFSVVECKQIDQAHIDALLAMKDEMIEAARKRAENEVLEYIEAYKTAMARTQKNLL